MFDVRWYWCVHCTPVLIRSGAITVLGFLQNLFVPTCTCYRIQYAASSSCSPPDIRNFNYSHQKKKIPCEYSTPPPSPSDFYLGYGSLVNFELHLNNRFYKKNQRITDRQCSYVDIIFNRFRIVFLELSGVSFRWRFFTF
jgi:hypothetical protein